MISVHDLSCQISQSSNPSLVSGFTRTKRVALGLVRSIGSYWKGLEAGFVGMMSRRFWIQTARDAHRPDVLELGISDLRIYHESEIKALEAIGSPELIDAWTNSCIASETPLVNIS